MLAVAGLYMMALAVAGLSTRPHACALAVVFGNTVGTDGQPSSRLRARLRTALALYRAGTVRSIMVSGGIEQPGHRDETRTMGAWLEARGVPSAAIVEDPEGTNTMATAYHAAVLAPGGGAVAVTQWFHLPRAMLAMHMAGTGNVSGAWPRFLEWRDAYSFLREGVALPVYLLKHFGADAPPAPAGARTPPA